MDYPGRNDIDRDAVEPKIDNLVEDLDYEDEPMEVATDQEEIEDGVELFSDNDMEYDADHPISDNFDERIRQRLTYNARAFMPLETVDTGYLKKFRFTILLPCPACHVANHVEFDDANREEKEICPECLGEKRFCRKVVYRVPITTGALHGSTITLPGAGHYYSKDIRGDVKVTLLDVPHEHFQRVYNDIFVCFQIDRTESVFGVTRILTLPWYDKETSPSSIVIQTAPGCQVNDNDVFRLEGLGLLSQHEVVEKRRKDEYYEIIQRTRGDVYVLFFVRSEHSIEPVKLRKVRIRSPSASCDDTNDDTVPVASPDPHNLNGSPVRSFLESKQNGVRSPRSRRRNREANECSKSTPGDGNPLRYEIHPPSRIPSEDMANLPIYKPFPDGKLTLLDRLVNHPGIIPLPFKEPVREIPVSELEPLWERRKYRSWWQRVSGFLHSGNTAPRPDVVSSDSKADNRLRSLKKSSCCPLCLLGGPLFELEDDTVDSSAEAAKELLTGKIGNIPDYDPKIILECRIPRCQVLKLIQRLKVYLNGPRAQGTS